MSNKPNKVKKKTGIKIFKSLVILILFLSLSGMGIVGGIVLAYIKSADYITPEELALKGFTTHLYDKNNQLLTPLLTDTNREMVDFKDVPEDLKDAFVAIEDKRFYQHKGVDVKRFTSAVFTYFKKGSNSHGGSTITQQVIKNITGERETTVKRKVQELWKAIELEKHLTKEQILEVYMNIIYMGNGSYGVQSASKLYFNKPVSELNLAQCAALAGITNAPSTYNPFTDKGKENLNARKEIILKEMLGVNAISEGEYESALKSPLNIMPPHKLSPTGHVQPYYADKVVLDVKRGLMAKGYSEDISIKMIYNNGLKIYTTIDPNVQSALDQVYTSSNHFSKVNPNTSQLPQSAMIILDSQNGQVRGLYGGAGAKVGGGLNRATDSQVQRQPGSTFKPIAVYGPAINERLITSASVFDDVPVHLNGADKPAYPKNYDQGYGGLTSIHNAVQRSVNVVAAKVWTINSSFPNIAHGYLKKVGIDRSDEKYVSVSLGGLEKGVNVMQMASAYVPFANRGLYYEPITYTKVVDFKGRVILDNSANSVIVYDEETSAVMTDIMQDVVKPGGTAYPYGIINNGKIPTAGKTGTTSDNKDKWFIGYSPYYVGATWYGYDKPVSLTSAEYSRALKIWHDVMEKAHSGLSEKSFTIPNGVVQKTVCGYSGKLVTDFCQQDPRGNAVREELFIKGTEPKDSDTCDVHIFRSVCTDASHVAGRNVLANRNCPPDSVESKVLIKRITPFYPISPNDPYPVDWKYGFNESESCTIHTAPPITTPTPSPRERIKNRRDRQSPTPTKSVSPNKVPPSSSDGNTEDEINPND